MQEDELVTQHADPERRMRLEPFLELVQEDQAPLLLVPGAEERKQPPHASVRARDRELDSLGSARFASKDDHEIDIGISEQTTTTEVRAVPENRVTEGMAGIFHYVAIEEAAIRENPAKRTTDILKQIFGSGQ